MTVLHLQFTRPDGETETYHLKGVRDYKIGRGSVCEIRILDMKMSRQHCKVAEREDGWYLEDLGSTNGARINGVKIDGSVKLAPGTSINVGLSELNVQEINESLDMGADAMIDDNLDEPGIDVAQTPEMARMETASIHGVPAPVAQEDIPEVENDVPIALSDSEWEAEPHQDQSGEMDSYDPQAETASAVEPKHPPPGDAVVDQSPADDGLDLEESEAPATVPQTEDYQAGSAPDPDPDPDPAPEPEPEPEPAAQAPAIPTPAPEPVVQHTSSQHYIKLLGKRVGPLSRTDARRLKAKELKGELTEDDLDSLPQA